MCVSASVPTRASDRLPERPDCRSRTASWPSFSAASAASACGRKARPASVSRARPRRRSNSGAPSSCSSRPSRRLIAGCERCSRAPARVKPPSSAMATKVSGRRCPSIRFPDADGKYYAFDRSTVLRMILRERSRRETAHAHTGRGRRRRSGRCTSGPAAFSSPIRGMRAPPRSWRRWATRRWRPPASASPTCSAAPTARSAARR